jgi:PhoPQ-activated pathogenicity-related protein
METFLDPLNYKDRLAKIPKYIVLSSDDEFMMFDWTNHYYDQFKELGETHLIISPNSEHSLTTAIPNVLSSAGVFIRSIASGKTSEDRPTFDYFKNEDDEKSITVTIPEQYQSMVKSVSLRHAETFSSKIRDFRWVTLASEDNKNCSLPWISVPKDQEDELKAKHGLLESD